MKRFCAFVLLMSVFIFSANVFADSTSSVDAHAPLGVMAEHIHKKGEWMTSYRYKRMVMDQNFSGSNEISVSQVHNQYMVAPVKMTMEMHMVGVMYGLTDKNTIMLMVPHVVKDMEHRNRVSRQFSTRAGGLGDIKVSGIYSLEEKLGKNILLNYGVSIPTGSIDRKDDTLLGSDQSLPYPMQLGSGTFDLLPGVTYTDHKDQYSWGVQGATVLRLSENDRDYTLGNRYALTAWGAYKWSKWLSTSIRFDYNKWGNIDGADNRLNQAMVQTSVPTNQAGERLDVLIGANLIGQDGWLQDHRIAFEIGAPVYQNLEGPQLGVGFLTTIGWQKAF